MNLRKTITFLLPGLLVVGCGGENYSGDYVNLIKTQKVYYISEKGTEVDPSDSLDLAAMLYGAMSGRKSNYQEAYRYELTKAILTLKQDGTTVDGKLILTNDKTLTEFAVKSGYVGDDKQLHLKFTYQPEVTLGASVSILSMSGPPGNVLLNFDQTITENDDELIFQASGAINVFGGLASEKIGKGAIKFIKLGKNDREKIFKDQVLAYIADDLKLLEESLNTNDPKKTQLYKELILSLGGDIPISVSEKLANKP